ncbi:MAG: translation elongation factor Ts [Candidatus Wallbacteria bacterium]|nr:translation elongation factor Ts [Candidatus Wallbacteria bacterium]
MSNSIDAKAVKDLRDMTGAGFMDCKAALTETKGNVEEAIDFLRKKGIAKASKKMDRKANEGFIGTYIHMDGKIGVLIELNCETDFVGRNEEFRGLAKDLAMHIAASNPRYIKPEDVPQSEIDKEREIYRDQMKESGKPANIVDKIVDGKISKYFEECCLLEQPFVKQPEKKVKDLIFEKIGKIGENIVVGSFSRIQIGNR